MSEVSLYDKNGCPVAYIADDNSQTIYLWEGEPVAYLYGEHVYGFNGRHLGWFLEGVIFGHDGCMLSAIREKFPGGTSGEPGKGGRQGTPGKAGMHGAPGRPGLYMGFSATPFLEVLSSGR